MELGVAEAEIILSRALQQGIIGKGRKTGGNVHGKAWRELSW